MTESKERVIAALREEIRALNLLVVHLTQERDTARKKLKVSRGRVRKWRYAAKTPTGTTLLPT